MNVLQNIIKGIKSNLSIFSFEGGMTEDNYKKFAELCIFFSYCCSENFEEEDKLIIKNFLLEEFEKIPADDIFKNSYMTFPIIMPYIFLSKFRKSQLFETSLKIMFNNNMFNFEVPPYRQMEWNFIKHKRGLIDKFTIENSSILTKNIFLCSVNRNVAYSITHSLFYITDFGFSSPDLDIVRLNKLKFQLECLIVKFYKENDLDVILELCINYFSLLPKINLNFQILNIIDDCISRNSFIENQYSEKKFTSKYHSLFVTGLLYALLSKHLNNSTLPIKIKEKLKKAIEQTAFLNGNLKTDSAKNQKIHSSMAFMAWEALVQLNYKEIDKKAYTRYVSSFGHNYFLELEIISNLELLKVRNENNILWDREFSYLKCDVNSIDLLKKEYQNKIESAILFHKNILKKIEIPINKHTVNLQTQ